MSKALSVEEGEPGEKAACSDVSCVTYSCFS